MKFEVSEEERSLSSRIYALRQHRDLKEAADLCDFAIERYPAHNFFYKVKGDILFELGQYERSIDEYMNYISCIKEYPEYFTNFMRFIQKVHKYYDIDEKIFREMYRIHKDNSYEYIIRKGVTKIIYDFFPISSELNRIIDDANQDYTKERIQESISNAQKLGKCEKIILLSRLDKGKCVKKNRIVNKYILKELESEQLFEDAMIWIHNILKYSNDRVDIRSLFRLCRNRNDYSEAKEFMSKRDIVDIKEFNIQYELVLFFEDEGDEISRNKALNYIEEISRESIPISQTLFNFYIKFDMLDKAKETQNRIDEKKKTVIISKKKKKQVEQGTRQNQEIIWKRLSELLAEQEHSRQLIAITDLIKGFSHELGQPITNIRYAIQLFYMKLDKSKEKIGPMQRELLDGIIIQTARVGKLLDRFSPITSSRSQKECFNVYAQIMSNFEEMDLRLSNEGISYSVEGDKTVELYGETLQFSQVFYNLIINSIYAINKHSVKGKILVNIEKKEDCLKIIFSDNGIGISRENQRKVFDPFFSTKRKETEEGGEGLGLYIVWNILKMFNGRVYVNPDYTEGAQFVMEIDMEEKKNV